MTARDVGGDPERVGGGVDPGERDVEVGDVTEQLAGAASEVDQLVAGRGAEVAVETVQQEVARGSHRRAGGHRRVEGADDPRVVVARDGVPVDGAVGVLGQPRADQGRRRGLVPGAGRLGWATVHPVILADPALVDRVAASMASYPGGRIRMLPPSKPLLPREITITMALSEKSRTTMYTTFAELLGEEVAAEMMSQYPATEGDELVTRQFLRAELAELRTEFHIDLRRQTQWITGVVVSALIGGMAVSAAVASAVG
ncbi:MAG: hypothetical protein U5R31_05000 [Acidimicrobiia bacterium]|nr:hypothetical protein [Acidimicrobiia bacterium]